MQGKLITKDLLTDEYQQVQELHADVWGYQHSIEYWHWKYRDHPGGTKAMIVVNEEGKMVSFCGFWNRTACIEGEAFPTVTLCDVMTLPEYRGHAAFKGILKKIRTEILPNSLFMGFTNNLSQRMFNAYFRSTGPANVQIPVRSMVVNPASFIKILKPFSWPIGALTRQAYRVNLHAGKHQDLTLIPVNDITPDFDTFWQWASKGYSFLMCRDSAYLRWRYINDPLFKYRVWKALDGEEMVGWIVSAIIPRQGKFVGKIMDWLVPRERPEIFHNMVRAVLRSMVHAKVDSVDMWLMPSESGWLKLFKRMFPLNKKSRTLCIGGGPIWHDSQHSEHKEKINRFDNFYMNLGDSDFGGR